ncbi:hypothetical protein pb186bvf_008828 [Paramecium bursaria]
MQAKNFKVLIGQIENNYDMDANIKRINISIQKYTKADNLDLIMFPETALVGYYYKQAKDIEPYLEEYGKGKTYEFCRQIAQRLNTYVICGYPEKDGDKKYNSGILVDRNGQPILNIRKKHLYETDKSWASEGNEFQYYDFTNTKNQKIRFGFGICMDINAYEFIQETDNFALALFCKQNNCEGLIFISAWTDNELDSDQVTPIHDYWYWRLYPLVNRKKGDQNKSFVFICSDKCGKDEKCTYFGGSCIFKINPNKMVATLNKRNESYLVCDVQL